MKKLFALILVLAMMLAFAACGGGGESFTPVNEEERDEILNSLEDWIDEANQWDSYKITESLSGSAYSEIGGDRVYTGYFVLTGQNQGLYLTGTVGKQTATIAYKDGRGYVDIPDEDKFSIIMPIDEFIDEQALEFDLYEIFGEMDEVPDSFTVSTTTSSGSKTIRIYGKESFSEDGDSYSYEGDLRFTFDANDNLVSIKMTTNNTAKIDGVTMKASRNVTVERFSGSIPYPSGLNSTNYPLDGEEPDPGDPNPSETFELVTSAQEFEQILEACMEWAESAEWQKFSGTIIYGDSDFSASGTLYVCNIEGQEAIAQKETDGIDEVEAYLKDGIVYRNLLGEKDSYPYDFEDNYTSIIYWVSSNGIVGDFEDAEIYITASSGARKIKICTVDLNYNETSEIIITVDANNKATKIVATYVELDGSDYTYTITLSPYAGTIQFPSDLNDTEYPFDENGGHKYEPSIKYGDFEIVENQQERDEIENAIEVWINSAAWQSYSGKVTQTVMGETAYGEVYACTILGQEALSVVLEGNGTIMATYIKDGKMYSNYNGEKESSDYNHQEDDEISLESALTMIMSLGFDNLEIFATGTSGARKIRLIFVNSSLSFYFSCEVIFTIDSKNNLTMFEMDMKSEGISTRMELRPWSGTIKFPDDLNETEYPPENPDYGKFEIVENQQERDEIENAIEVWINSAAWQTYNGKMTASIMGETTGGQIYGCTILGQEALSVVLEGNGMIQATYIKDGKMYTNYNGEKESRNYNHQEDDEISLGFYMEEMMDLGFENLDVFATATDGARKVRLSFEFVDEDSFIMYEVIFTIDSNNNLILFEMTFESDGISARIDLKPWSGTITFPSDLNTTNYPPA